jgi:TatD DNase family protein
VEYFNLHTHQLHHPEGVTALVNQYPWEFHEDLPCYSIGIHPWYIQSEHWKDHLSFMEEKMSDPACFAIGECGLDKRIEVPWELQMEVFEAQIQLAEHHHKPLVIHCVGAYSELIALKKKHHIKVPVIIHGFSKNSQVAQELIKVGYYLSFGKYLLRNPELKEVFLKVPSNQFFLETDTIEETIQDVYFKAAAYKSETIDSIKTQINTTFANVFKNSIPKDRD